MDLSKYNIPPGRPAKAALLKAMMKGELTIDDLKEAGYEVTMWRECEDAPDYLQTFDGSLKISKAEYEKKRLAATSKEIFVTLNLEG